MYVLIIQHAIPRIIFFRIKALNQTMIIVDSSHFAVQGKALKIRSN